MIQMIKCLGCLMDLWILHQLETSREDVQRDVRSGDPLHDSDTPEIALLAMLGRHGTALLGCSIVMYGCGDTPTLPASKLS